MKDQKKLQPLNGGFLEICNVADVSEPGEMPVKGLRVVSRVAYAERTVGMKRFWTAMREAARVDLVVRCHLGRGVSPYQIVVMPDGEQYEIVQVQHILDTAPPAMDLSLQRLKDQYEQKEWWC